MVVPTLLRIRKLQLIRVSALHTPVLLAACADTLEALHIGLKIEIGSIFTLTTTTDCSLSVPLKDETFELTTSRRCGRTKNNVVVLPCPPLQSWFYEALAVLRNRISVFYGGILWDAALDNPEFEQLLYRRMLRFQRPQNEWKTRAQKQRTSGLKEDV